MDEDGRWARLAQLALRRHSSVIHVHRVHSRYLVPRFGREPEYMIPTGMLDFPEGRYQIGRFTANVGPRAP